MLRDPLFIQTILLRAALTISTFTFRLNFCFFFCQPLIFSKSTEEIVTTYLNGLEEKHKVSSWKCTDCGSIVLINSKCRPQFSFLRNWCDKTQLGGNPATSSTSSFHKRLNCPRDIFWQSRFWSSTGTTDFPGLFAKMLWPLRVTTETQTIKTSAPFLAFAPWRTFYFFHMNSIWHSRGLW